MIRSRFQGMYWCAHKTATITSFQRTVEGGGGAPHLSLWFRHPCLNLMKIIGFLLPLQSKINDLEILFQKLITFTKHLASVKLCLRDELIKYTTACHPPDLVREPDY